MKKVSKENFRRSNRTEPRLRWRVLASFFSAAAICLSAQALEVYQIPGNVTDGIDLLGMSDNYYTDRLKGRNSCTISGEVTHSDVSVENPFLLMGNHTVTTAFNPSTKLDTIPIRIVDGGAWKYLTDGGSLAIYHSGSGHGQLDIEKGFFQAYALRLYGEDAERSVLYVTNDCRVELATTLFIGSHERNGTFVLDGGDFIAYSAVVMGQYTNSSGTASANTSVNTAIVANATLNLDSTGESAFRMGRWGATDGADKATDRNVLILGEGGVLYSKSISRHADARGHIFFRGGKYKCFRRGTGNTSNNVISGDGNGTLELEGDGYPIHIDVGTNVFNLCYDWTSPTRLTGNGGFKKSGSGKLTINYANNRLRSSFSGGVFVDDGILSVDAGRGDRIPATNLLTVAESAVFDMNGSAVGFTGAVGAGVVTNSSESAATLTLGYGDGDYTFSATVGGDVSIVKAGNGTLTVSGNAANNACDLDIMSGSVAFGVKNSSAYKNVTVRSGATLDISKCNFVCAKLVKEPGGTIKHKPGFSIFVR